MFDSARLLRFAVVGVITAAAYFGLLALVVEFGQAEAVVASALCYIVAVIMNYLLHYSWTFAPEVEAKPAPHGQAMLRYLVMVACGFLLNTALMFVLVNGLSWHYLVAQSVALVAVVLWNFALSSLWVFRS